MQFVDLAAQRARLGGALDQAIKTVTDSGAFILGPQVAEFEQRLADYVGVRNVIGCASGTDALQIPLMAWGVGPGDAVFVPSFTFASTAEVVALLGAEPVFIDIDPDTYLMDVRSLEAAIAAIMAEGRLTPRAVVPVDLFGMVADYGAIMPLAERHGLKVISDAAQAIGATREGVPCGRFGHVAATSFYPAKPLGCYGDGGAVLTDDDDLAAVMRSVAFHGKGESQYDNVRIGLTSRLDTIQAAVLGLKLDIFDDEIAARQRIAARYHAGLRDVVKAAHNPQGMQSAWAQYAIEAPDRDRLKAHLDDKGIPSAIYYTKPLHQQAVYRRYPVAPGGLPVTEAKPSTILCLPIHPYLAEDDQERVIAEIRDFVRRNALSIAAE
ncbi:MULTISPECIES: DegT/DnrJ/EryC1/StrS aminotransferase family protein [unclassified Roseitalea]|uniref:DegT/DnrJ/EryC1/StrS family aminotransferase n=1 Tax=unclassified Roseitalea TaxID=2639107 RepID=UPI0027402AAC|nr:MULTISPECIES: DegT/DnrJ/EryC1/StrS aminotransferase family protein [unclassified Roseitalea]